RHPRALRLLQLRARALADDDAARLLRDRVGHLRAALLEQALRLVAAQGLERARDHVRLAGERALLRPLLRAGLELEAERAQLLDERAVLLVGEPLGDQLGAVRSDAFYLHDLFRCRVAKPVDRAEVRGEVARDHPTDLGDVEPEEHAPERLLLRPPDPLDPRGR